MYFIVLGGESVPTNKTGRPDPVALMLLLAPHFLNWYIAKKKSAFFLVLWAILPVISELQIYHNQGMTLAPVR